MVPKRKTVTIKIATMNNLWTASNKSKIGKFVSVSFCKKLKSVLCHKKPKLVLPNSRPGIY